MKERKFLLTVWHDPRAKSVLGVFSESYCRAYCKRFASSIHISCEEVF